MYVSVTEDVHDNVICFLTSWKLRAQRKMPRLEEIANVALRVPSILVLDLLYKCDIDSLTEHLKAKNEDMLFKYKYVIWNLYYFGMYKKHMQLSRFNSLLQNI